METLVKVLFRTEGGGFDALLDALRVAAWSLLLSNNIRRWVVVEADLTMAGRPYCLRVHGSEVRGLAPQETAVEGLARSLLRRGRWPGVSLELGHCSDDGCISAEDFLDGMECPSCLVLGPGGAGFKPRWLAAALMVVHDERCVCRRRDGAGEEAAAGATSLRQLSRQDVCAARQGARER